MPKKCKTKEDIITRNKAFVRLMKILNCTAGIPPLEIYGLKSNKSGSFTIDELELLIDNP